MYMQRHISDEDYNNEEINNVGMLFLFFRKRNPMIRYIAVIEYMLWV